MNEVTHAEFQTYLAKYGFPAAHYEFGKRYTVARYHCHGYDGVRNSRIIERHAILFRGKEISVTYLVPAELLENSNKVISIYEPIPWKESNHV